MDHTFGFHLPALLSFLRLDQLLALILLLRLRLRLLLLTSLMFLVAKTVTPAAVMLLLRDDDDQADEDWVGAFVGGPTETTPRVRAVGLGDGTTRGARWGSPGTPRAWSERT